MGLLSRIFGSPPAAKAVEGEYRDGPWFLPLTGGFLPHDVGTNLNWWQLGYDPIAGGTSAMVEACVSAYSQTTAMCPGDHWLSTDNGGRGRVKTSALSRFLRKPNGYQSISDFLMNTTRCLYMEGNSYALGLRNDRFEVAELHLMNPKKSTYLIAETGDVFYRLGGNEIIDKMIDGPLIVPARDVLHIRLHTPEHPLRGETPLMAAAIDVAAGNSMMRQQLAFYTNQARPSQVLSTEMVLDKEQVDQLRERWNEQSRGLHAGGTPILTAGLKPLPLGTTAHDAQLADMMKLTEQHIALVFRVPLQILGIGGTPFASTEALMQAWKASGLGFCLNHIEEAIGLFFGLRGVPDEYLEFDTKALLRSSFKERIEGLVRGVQGGVYAPNEARAEESLPAAEFGDEPRVQEQVVPLSFGAKKEPNPKPSASVKPPPADDPSDEDQPNADKSGVVQSTARSILDAADECDRRAA